MTTRAYNQTLQQKFSSERLLMREETYQGFLETFDGVQVRFGAGGARCQSCPLALTCVAAGMRFRLLICGKRWGTVRVHFFRSGGETDRGYCSRMTPFPCIYMGDNPPIPDFSTSCNKCLEGPRKERWKVENAARQKLLREKQAKRQAEQQDEAAQHLLEERQIQEAARDGRKREL